MKFSDYLYAFVVLALIMVLCVLLLGLFAPSQPVINGNFVSDNWFHVAHPYWTIGCAVLILVVCTPEIILFWRKKTKA